MFLFNLCIGKCWHLATAWTSFYRFVCFLQVFKSALTLPAKNKKVSLAQGHLAGLVPVFVFPCTKCAIWYLDVIKRKVTDLRPNFPTHISQIPIFSVFSPSRIYIAWRCLCYYILVQVNYCKVGHYEVCDQESWRITFGFLYCHLWFVSIYSFQLIAATSSNEKCWKHWW